MKKSLFLLIISLYCGVSSAQDTIFIKTGEKIPAVIVSKNETQVKYKRSGQKEPAAIYSVFVSDIKSIHYSNGTVTDYSIAVNQPERRKTALQMAGEYGTVKFSFMAAAGNYFRNKNDNLDAFWVGLGNPVPGGNHTCYKFDAQMSFQISMSKRHWVSLGIQDFSVPRAIYGLGKDGLDEISMGVKGASMYLSYGYAFNRKKNMVSVFEFGIEGTDMTGEIFKLNNTDVKLFCAPTKSSMHLSAGIDWLFSKILQGNFRIGQRFCNSIKEEHLEYYNYHYYKTSYLVNGSPLTMKLSGLYATFGLSGSFYVKMKTGRPGEKSTMWHFKRRKETKSPE